jgi:hypothetical protein
LGGVGSNPISHPIHLREDCVVFVIRNPDVAGPVLRPVALEFRT